ncbi:ATP-NAD kinase-like domain-containing protein [Chlamydoabsidia padenii]|nr:ATP-NAD kinase-like domain-containing protein [Chlamydoabsidia padenii]
MNRLVYSTRLFTTRRTLGAFAQKRYYQIGSPSLLTDLPNKVDLELTPDTSKDSINDQSLPLMTARYANDIVQVPGSTFGGQFKLTWKERPRNILIVKKPNDVNTEKALVDIARWLNEHYHGVNIIVEPEVADHFKKDIPFANVIPKDDHSRIVDFAISLGGDGTMLHLSSLFPKAVPPVICFSMGTLGFLMSFKFQHYANVLDDMMNGRFALMLRMRLFCSLHQQNGKRITVDGQEVGDRQVMNEVSLHRGRYTHLTAIDCYVDNHHLTECVADGLIVSTPTGSTAYSLSAGGPIVHPSVQSLVLTPICPRSLSFRTALLPPSATIQLKIGESSKSQVEVSMDGQEIFLLDKGEYLQVRMSKYPVPCVTRTSEGNDWATDINELLKWNNPFRRSLDS